MLLGCASMTFSFGQAQFPTRGFNPEQKIFNIKDFGATGDSITMDTKVIQAAIEACTESGGGIVWVPAGNYHIGTLRLKSNVTLSLDYGAALLGSQKIEDYDTDLKNHGRAMCIA